MQAVGSTGGVARVNGAGDAGHSIGTICICELSEKGIISITQCS